jgi:hypothetical protein
MAHTKIFVILHTHTKSNSAKMNSVSYLPNHSASSMMSAFDCTLNNSIEYSDDVLDSLLNLEDDDLLHEFVATMGSNMSPYPVKPVLSCGPSSAMMSLVPPALTPPVTTALFTHPVCVSPSPSVYSETNETIMVPSADVHGTKSNPNKRRRTGNQASSLKQATAAAAAMSVLTDDRRDRNREHAKRSRLRKKSLTANLEQSMIELKKENEKLRQHAYAQIGKNETDALIQERLANPSQKVIAALKMTHNRILDNETIIFLQSLRKDASYVKKSGIPW